MLFAANHVLHRLLPPRHPPSALISLTIILVSLGMSIRLLAKSVEISRLQHRLMSCMQDALSSERYSVVKDRRIRRSLARLFGAGAPRSVRRVLLAAQHAAKKVGPGGAGRDRTDDLRLAKPALSQLSYSPGFPREQFKPRTRPVLLPHSPRASMVGLGRFELPTSRLSGGRSNQLSYRPAEIRTRVS